MAIFIPLAEADTDKLLLTNLENIVTIVQREDCTMVYVVGQKQPFLVSNTMVEIKEVLRRNKVEVLR